MRNLVVIIAIIAIASIILEERLHERYVLYWRIGEVALIGYFVTNSISNIFYKFSYDQFGKNAKAIKVLIRIMGSIIIMAIIISYLSQDPLVAASVGTITAIVIGFASQNVLGNAISGLYLAITRPFKIGNKVTVFGNTGTVYDIGLLYTKLITEEGDTILAPNASLVSTNVIIRKS